MGQFRDKTKNVIQSRDIKAWLKVYEKKLFLLLLTKLKNKTKQNKQNKNKNKNKNTQFTSKKRNIN